MKRIHQTVTDEAYAVYMGLVDRKTGLSAALMLFSVMDVPGEAFKKLLMGDEEGFRQMFKQTPGVKAIPQVSSKMTILEENDDETVEFDPFDQF